MEEHIEILSDWTSKAQDLTGKILYIYKLHSVAYVHLLKNYSFWTFLACEVGENSMDTAVSAQNVFDGSEICIYRHEAPLLLLRPQQTIGSDSVSPENLPRHHRSLIALQMAKQSNGECKAASSLYVQNVEVCRLEVTSLCREKQMKLQPTSLKSRWRIPSQHE